MHRRAAAPAARPCKGQRTEFYSVFTLDSY
ncbi:hypothetical protein MTBUT4_480008 [Magnetospirillum sp. UT-4]|nr:hypothetical protein MTBUT4_480008 [Magnetospirillum sp. UT-4]